MTTLRRVPRILVFLTLAGCAAPAPQAAPVDTAAVMSAIQAREKEWSAAFLAGDAAAIAALYTEDGASVPATGDWQRGRAAIAQGLQPQFDSTNFTAREDITDEVIPIGADYVFEIGHYSSMGTSKMDSSARTTAGRYIVLWRRDADGVWRLHRDMGTESQTKPPM